jgi:hypothetical protein
MAELNLGIKFLWEERSGDCEPCKVCKEPIYLKRYVPVIMAGNRRTEIEASFCESCYNEMIDGESV